jgi:hypothetical protein
MSELENQFRGAISAVALEGPGVASSAPPGIDLPKMARRAMNYFLKTPRPHLNYACRFNNGLDHCPPGPQGEDLVAHGDTDARMDAIYPGLRELSGLTEGTEVDEGVHKRVLGYLGDDDLSHAPYAMCCATDMPPDTEITSLWTTGWTIRSITERWLRNRDAELKERARRSALALKKLASWDSGRAYFPGGLLLEGKWLGGCFGAEANFYTNQVSDLLHYAEAAGDEEIAEFAYALARGIAAGLPGGLGMRRFREDGSFTDHTHMHTRVLWGVAMAGRVMRDPALIEWARRGYEFVRSRGTDFGWFPERMILPGEHPYDGYEERVDVAETCCMGDMTQTAIELAKAGYPHYWDHVERYVANYLREVQFSITPAVESFYRGRHAALPSAELRRGLEILRDFEGGFMGCVGVNEWAGVLGPLNMAGCCVPEGARALVTAANHVMTEEKGLVRVNMSLGHAGKAATVHAGEGTLEVTAKRASGYLLRPPGWAERQAVTALRNGKEIEPAWENDYLRFENVSADDTVGIRYPVPHFLQRVSIGGRLEAQRAYTVQWVGNRVLEIRPPGKSFPMFSAPSCPEADTASFLFT